MNLFRPSQPQTNYPERNIPTMALRRLVFALAALLLLGLVASPAAARAQSDPIQPAAFVDTDEDGLSDADEAIHGTDPAVYDTDYDGLSDGFEVRELGTDPLRGDSDEDGLGDGDELEVFQTDPLAVDTD